MAFETMAVSSRFAAVSKEDRDKLLCDAITKSTRVITAFWIRVFEAFCKSQKNVCDLESVDEDSLADVLHGEILLLLVQKGRW